MIYSMRTPLRSMTKDEALLKVLHWNERWNIAFTRNYGSGERILVRFKRGELTARRARIALNNFCMKNKGRNTSQYAGSLIVVS